MWNLIWWWFSSRNVTAGNPGGTETPRAPINTISTGKFLLESGDLLLLESGDSILLEEDV